MIELSGDPTSSVEWGDPTVCRSWLYLADVHTIVLTHLHSDHCLELGPLLYTIWVSSPKREIRLFGPREPNTRLKRFAAMSYDIKMRMADERQDPSDMFTTPSSGGQVFRTIWFASQRCGWSIHR